MTDRRPRLLFVTLSCARLERSLSPALDALHAWLDSWSGMEVIEHGMARQGYDLQLTRYANEGWRGTFFLTGREHSMTKVWLRLQLAKSHLTGSLFRQILSHIERLAWHPT